MTTPTERAFHAERCFLPSFLFLLSYNFSYFVVVGGLSLTHVSINV